MMGELSVLRPFILPPNLRFLLRSEIIGDVECLADLLRRLPLDHVGHSLAANIEERLDVQVVGSLPVEY